MPLSSNRSAVLCTALAFAVSLAAPVAAADVSVLLPLKRSAYQANEWIDVSVVHNSKEAVTLTVAGADDSRMTFTFPARQPDAKDAVRVVGHYHLNGWLLRPGKYKLTATSGNETSEPVEIDVVTHIRKSDFKLINWGRAKGKEQLPQGEDSLGYNVAYAAYSRDESDGFLRAGMDYFSNCTMSGGHQMDLRLECDWSDPNVFRGGTRRVTKQALNDRTKSNAVGVHFYDEPGLTWHKHPETGEFGPHGVPAQLRAFKAAFDRDALGYNKVDPKNPEHVKQWKHWARWKLAFMDAAWKDAQFGVSQVRPDFLSVTQSQYGWSAPTDGYYFNVARSLPVTSGHGGYDDVGSGYYYPSFVMEMARARDHWKPCWYLPTWYGNTPSDRYRLEQYLSFQAGINGLMSPPDLDPIDPVKSAAGQGIV
jgi:hypothetical protein